MGIGSVVGWVVSGTFMSRSAEPRHQLAAHAQGRYRSFNLERIAFARGTGVARHGFPKPRQDLRFT
jgi:hypothetical protein